MEIVPDSASATHTPALLSRLRRETRTQHGSLESALDLTSVNLTRDAYRRRLEQFYGFYAPVEARLLALGGWSERGIDLSGRLKTPLLEADLQTLGVAAEALPLCADLPELSGVPQGFGCLYVLEGATLGGQLISRHLRRTLDFGAEGGARFFQSYGKRVPERWKAFGAALVAYATTPALEDAVVRGAVETFDTLHHWLVQRSMP